jgi:hypothetical protein
LSFAIGYSPVCNLYTNPLIFNNHEYYWNSVSGRLMYKLSDRISILASVRTRQNKVFLRYDQYPDAYYRKRFMEFPVQLNYNIHRSSDTFSPYIKIAVINSLLQTRIYEGPTLPSVSEYNFLTDLGIGTSLRIIRSISLVGEISLGYFITYQERDRAYVSGFFGLQYQF